MTKLFGGDPIAGLPEAMGEVLKGVRIKPPYPMILRPSDKLELLDPPIEFDELVKAIEAQGIQSPHLREHVWWLSVNEPRVVYKGQKITQMRKDF